MMDNYEHDSYDDDEEDDGLPKKTWCVRLSPEMSQREIIQFLGGLQIMFSGTDEEFQSTVPLGLRRWMVEKR